MEFRNKIMKKNRLLRKIAKKIKFSSNKKYLTKHPEFEHFSFPKTFYFKYCSCGAEIHWAIIKEVDNKFKIYFINNWGRVFDELEFGKKKIAQRQLRKNGFDFSTNTFCPFIPPEPIYIKLSKGKKSAPYSIGNKWKKIKRNKKHIDCLKKAFLRNQVMNRNSKIDFDTFKRLSCRMYFEDKVHKIIETRNKLQNTNTKLKELFNLFCSFILVVFVLFYIRGCTFDFKEKIKNKPQPPQIEYKQ
jgi:hypothetical protein